MSVVCKCDRCGTYTCVSNRHRIETHGMIGLEPYENDYDLCPECRDEFIEFMKGVPAPSLLDRLRAMLKRKD